MYYFRFEIPRHQDGAIAVYPDGWFGTMDKCPQNVTVLLLNDKEAWGIAQADDTFVPPEVTVISETVALNLLSITKQASDVFVGKQKIAERFASRETKFDVAVAEYRKRLFDTAIEKVLNGS